MSTELEGGHSAAPRCVPGHLRAVGLDLARTGVAGAVDLGVEGAGQAAVARDQQKPYVLHLLPFLENREVGDALGGLGGAARHTTDALRVWPQLLDALLGTAKPRREDHLHGAGDLLDVLHRAEAALDVFLCCHEFRVSSFEFRVPMTSGL